MLCSGLILRMIILSCVASIARDERSGNERSKPGWLDTWTVPIVHCRWPHCWSDLAVSNGAPQVNKLTTLSPKCSYLYPNCSCTYHPVSIFDRAPRLSEMRTHVPCLRSKKKGLWRSIVFLLSPKIFTRYKYLCISHLGLHPCNEVGGGGGYKFCFVFVNWFLNWYSHYN